MIAVTACLVFMFLFFSLSSSILYDFEEDLIPETYTTTYTILDHWENTSISTFNCQLNTYAQFTKRISFRVQQYSDSNGNIIYYSLIVSYPTNLGFREIPIGKTRANVMIGNLNGEQRIQQLFSMATALFCQKSSFQTSGITGSLVGPVIYAETNPYYYWSYPIYCGAIYTPNWNDTTNSLVFGIRTESVNGAISRYRITMCNPTADPGECSLVYSYAVKIGSNEDQDWMAFNLLLQACMNFCFPASALCWQVDETLCAISS
jgi:hypothetical protein